MQANPTRALSLDDVRGPAAPLSVRVHPTVRARKRIAAWLTIGVLALGMLISIGVGADAAFIYFLSLVVPLFLLWMSTDMLRSDELHDVEASRDVELKPEHTDVSAPAQS